MSQNKPNNAPASCKKSCPLCGWGNIAESCILLSCKEKTQMVFNSSSAQMTRTAQRPQLEGERSSTLAKQAGTVPHASQWQHWVLSHIQHVVYPAVPCTLSLQLLNLCFFPS